MALPILRGQVEPVNGKFRRLTFIALASLGLYLLLAWRYPLKTSLANPRASWVSMVEPTLVNAMLHLAIYLALTLLYLAALRLLHALADQDPGSPKRQVPIIFVTWLACSAVLMFASPAGESHDIYDYLFRGRMMVEYQANPLVEVPETFGLTTPFTRYLAWRKNVDTYGPVWEAASATVALGVRQTARWLDWWDPPPPVCPKGPESCRLLMTYVSGYRLLAILLTGLTGVLVYRMVKDDRPPLAALALAAWLWNPLTLIASALGGHNDAVMIVLLMAGWRLMQRQRPLASLLVLLLAAHVKLTALIWLPACGLWIIWRWGWGRALRVWLASAASGVVLSWLLYAPFGGWQTLPRMLRERSAYLANSLWHIVKYLLTDMAGWASKNALRFVTNLSTVLFLIGALLIPLWLFNFRPKRWRDTPIPPAEGDRLLWRALAAVSMWYLLVGSYWFQHWYVLWALAPAVLLPESRLTRLALPWLAFGALSSNMLMHFLRATLLQNASLLLVYITPLILIWTPLLVAISLDKSKALKWGLSVRDLEA